MCRKHVLPTVIAALLALATMSQAQQILISVNCDVEERNESTLDGPLDGDGGSDVGTGWNQIPLDGPGRGRSQLRDAGAVAALTAGPGRRSPPGLVDASHARLDAGPRPPILQLRGS